VYRRQLLIFPFLISTLFCPPVLADPGLLGIAKSLSEQPQSSRGRYERYALCMRRAQGHQGKRLQASSRRAVVMACRGDSAELAGRAPQDALKRLRAAEVRESSRR
jgi:hypothetical protein